MTPEDSRELNEWCEQWLGGAPREVIFERGHISRVIGAELSDGSHVVIKVRRPATRISGCVAVQRHLFAAGYPCPEPLAGPASLGPYIATAERLVPGGVELDLGGEAPRLFAELLAALVTRAPSVSAVPSLEPSPPWVGWTHDGSETWPHPDDLDLDLNEHPGPGWIDDLGSRLRERLADSMTEPVIGHADWESHNIRWTGKTPLAVDDWDSVAALSEAAIAGAAAAVFPSSSDGTVVAADVHQTEMFLDAYRHARDVQWSTSDDQVCWAAGLWVLAYNAKKEVLGRGNGYVNHLNDEARERMSRAGI